MRFNRFFVRKKILLVVSSLMISGISQAASNLINGNLSDKIKKRYTKKLNVPITKLGKYAVGFQFSRITPGITFEKRFSNSLSIKTSLLYFNVKSESNVYFIGGIKNYYSLGLQGLYTLNKTKNTEFRSYGGINLTKFSIHVEKVKGLSYAAGFSLVSKTSFKTLEFNLDFGYIYDTYESKFNIDGNHSGIMLGSGFAYRF